MPTAPNVAGEGTWSDRDIAEGMRLTAISVKIGRGSNYIAEIRAR